MGQSIGGGGGGLELTTERRYRAGLPQVSTLPVAIIQKNTAPTRMPLKCCTIPTTSTTTSAKIVLFSASVGAHVALPPVRRNFVRTRTRMMNEEAGGKVRGPHPIRRGRGLRAYTWKKEKMGTIT